MVSFAHPFPVGEQLDVMLSLTCLCLPRELLAVAAVAVGRDGGSGEGR